MKSGTISLSASSARRDFAAYSWLSALAYDDPLDSELVTELVAA
jgi:hypothetical protein